jgi:aryl-alcohol dehydrogenase-like predicted oxidoreductase
VGALIDDEEATHDVAGHDVAGPEALAMRYEAFGRTGVQVSRLCFGAMMLGKWGNPDHDDSVAVLHAALDAGINFIDTADVYSAGESEEIVGKAIAGRRDDVVLATKFFSVMGEERNMRGGSRRWIMRECEESLRRLGTDHLDLYQVHRLDPEVDIDETLGALSDLVHQGKVRYLGTSTWPASAIVEAQWVAQRRNRERFVCEQPPYSMLARGIEADVLPTCLRHGIAVIPWGPLGGGWLSGRWHKGGDPVTSRRADRVPARYDMSDPGNQRKLDATDALGKLAADAGLSLVHLAVAWVLRNPAITSVIIGPRMMEQLTTQLGAVDVDLDDDLLDRVDEIAAPGSNFTWSDAGYLPPMVADSRARRRPR